MLQFTKRQLFLGASVFIGALLLSHQTGLYTPFGSKLAERAAGFGQDNDPYSDGMLLTDLHLYPIDSNRIIPQVDTDPPIEVRIKLVAGCEVISRIYLTGRRAELSRNQIHAAAIQHCRIPSLVRSSNSTHALRDIFWVFGRSIWG